MGCQVPCPARDAAGARADLRTRRGFHHVPDTDPDSKADGNPQADPDPHAQTNPEAHAQADAEGHAQADPEAHAETGDHAEADPEADREADEGTDDDPEADREADEGPAGDRDTGGHRRGRRFTDAEPERVTAPGSGFGRRDRVDGWRLG
jgi:hypothetical protein